MVLRAMTTHVHQLIRRPHVQDARRQQPRAGLHDRVRHPVSVTTDEANPLGRRNTGGASPAAFTICQPGVVCGQTSRSLAFPRSSTTGSNQFSRFADAAAKARLSCVMFTPAI